MDIQARKSWNYSDEKLGEGGTERVKRLEWAVIPWFQAQLFSSTQNRCVSAQRKSTEFSTVGKSVWDLPQVNAFQRSSVRKQSMCIDSWIFQPHSMRLEKTARDFKSAPDAQTHLWMSHNFSKTLNFPLAFHHSGNSRLSSHPWRVKGQFSLKKVRNPQKILHQSLYHYFQFQFQAGFLLSTELLVSWRWKKQQQECWPLTHVL